MSPRRISQQQRQELLDALRRGEVTNATAFAETYATQHGLNPNTVRSMIGRLRREAGLPSQREVNDSLQLSTAVRSELIARILGARSLGTDDPDELADLGAAVLARYDNDPQFQRAVDQRREAFAKVFAKLDELIQAAQAVDVTDELITAMLRIG